MKKQRCLNADCDNFLAKAQIRDGAKYCGYSCSNKFVAKKNKKNKKGFWDSKIQSELGKRGGKRTQELYPNLAIKNGKRANETHKKNKTNFYNSKFQSEMGKRANGKGGRISGPIVAKILREKKGYVFNNIQFDSKSEMEIGMNIHYQIERLIIGENYEILVGNLHYDFLIKKYKCFIEYHPYNKLHDKEDKNLESYYNKRRVNLDLNGYEEYKLLIIK